MFERVLREFFECPECPGKRDILHPDHFQEWTLGVVAWRRQVLLTKWVAAAWGTLTESLDVTVIATNNRVSDDSRWQCRRLIRPQGAEDSAVRL